MGRFGALKQKLESRRVELQDRLERLKRDISKPHSSDWDDQAQERENDEVLSQLGREAEQELRSVNAALDRMKSDQYGVCVNCTAEIPLARLEVKPEAIHCVNCAA